MNFAPVIVATPAKAHRAAPTHDCGVFGRLTVREICERTGLAKQSVQSRIDRGRTGAEILAERGLKMQHVARYDCGKAGMLTLKQIAKRAGISVSGAQRRVRMGISGERLLVRSQRERQTEQPARTSLLRSLRIVKAFPNTVPTVAEICRVSPMSRSNAIRYQAALREIQEAA